MYGNYCYTAPYYFFVCACVLTCQSTVRAQSMPGEDLRSGLLATTADTNVSSSINPAATGSEGSSSGRLWIYDPYGIRELRIAGAALTFSNRATGIGLSAQSVNYDRLLLVQTNLIFARELSGTDNNRARIGLKLRLQYARLSEQNSAHSPHVAAGVQLGILIEIAPGVYLGSLLGNWLSMSDQPDPAGGLDAGMGIGVQLYSRVRLLADIHHTKYFGIDVRAGIEFSPVSVFRMQAGLASNPERFTVGVTFVLNPVRIHFVVNRHNLLGSSRASEMQLEL